jgi:uncharacterized protein YbaP (TraB family)
VWSGRSFPWRRRARARLLACAALLLPAACATRPRAEATAAPGPPASERYLTPLAWEAREPGHAGAVYLLGSIHVGARPFGSLHPAIVAAYGRSEELVVEVDLSAASDAAALADAWDARAFLPEGQRLDQVIGPDTWRRLSDWLASRGIDPAPLLPLKPWAVLLKLLRGEFERQGYVAEQGVDRAFLDAAAGRKRIVALESYELQLDLYDSFPYETQELMLRDLLDPQDPQQTAALVDAWGRGDEQAFLDLLFPEAERWRPYQERFFFERNEHMAQRLSELARDGKTRFVVVGVGHMVGPRGIPALLASRGFAVQRIGQD